MWQSIQNANKFIMNIHNLHKRPKGEIKNGDVGWALLFWRRSRRNRRVSPFGSWRIDENFITALSHTSWEKVHTNSSRTDEAKGQSESWYVQLSWAQFGDDVHNSPYLTYQAVENFWPTGCRQLIKGINRLNWQALKWKIMPCCQFEMKIWFISVLIYCFLCRAMIGFSLSSLSSDSRVTVSVV